MFFILPNIAGLFLGFTDWSSFYPLKPTFNGISNFIDIFNSSIFYTSIKNTLYFAIITTVVKIFFGFILAILLNGAVKFKNLYRTIIFSPVVVNPLVVALIFSALYNPTDGPINGFLRSMGLGMLQKDWLTDVNIAMNSICIMEVWMGIGVTVVIFLAGLQTVPKEYYESSTIDGASNLQQFIHITIPLTFHAITINTVLCLLKGIGVFAQVYGLTNGGPADATQVYGTFIFKSFAQGLFGYSAAAGILLSVVVSIVSFLLLGFFRKMEVEY
jgi:ABC-type sugar transport systems, permease components